MVLRAGRPRAARASTGSCSRRCARRATPARSSTASCAGSTRTRDRARQEVQARHLGRRRPPGDEGGPAQAARRVARGRRRSSPRASSRSSCYPAAASAFASGGGEGLEEGAAEGPGAEVLSGPERRQARRGARLLASSSPASTAAPRCPSSSRGSSPSTRRTALPALSRARLPAGHRPRADRPRPDALDLRGRARAVDQGGLAVSPAAARGGRRGERDRHRRRLARPAAGRSRAAARGHRRPAPHDLLPQPLRSPAHLHGPLRGHAAQPPAPLREHRVREHPRAGRVADGAAAVPGVRRRPAAAREPRGHGRRAQHLRVHAALGAAGRWSGSRRSS